jgi:hypothetical protein
MIHRVLETNAPGEPVDRLGLADVSQAVGIHHVGTAGDPPQPDHRSDQDQAQLAHMTAGRHEAPSSRRTIPGTLDDPASPKPHHRQDFQGPTHRPLPTSASSDETPPSLH